jgi:hypothetical protein
MSLLDEFIKSGIGTANQTITETRSNTSRKLQGFVMGALPRTNRIPGPLGGFAESLTGNITGKVGDGLKQVFDAVGVPFDTKVKLVNERVYNNGVAAAQNVWHQIDSGEYKVGDIVAGAQEPLTLLKYSHDTMPPDDVTAPLESNASHPTPYAMDLFRLAPKHKFLFVVEFVFNGGYDFIGSGQRSKNDFAVVIKEFDRPKVKYEHEPDVNFYNFRSSVVKRVIHDTLTIKFLDDRQNLAMTFFHKYMKATHPITSVEAGSAAFYEDNGMNFASNINSSSTGVLENNLKTILKEIKVYHLYDFGAMMNVHHFTNPKIVSIEHDNWDMSDSNGSSINSQFTYDSWNMELGIKVAADEASLLGTLSNSGKYQLRPMQTPPPGDHAGVNQDAGPESTIRESLGNNERLVTATEIELAEATRRAGVNPGDLF